MKKVPLFIVAYLFTALALFGQKSDPPTIQAILQNSYPPFVDSNQVNDKNSNNVPTRTDLPANGNWLIWNAERDLLFYSWNDSGVIHTNNQIWGWTINQPIHHHTYLYYDAIDSVMAWDSGSTGGITSLIGIAPITVSGSGGLDTVSLANGTNAQILIDSAGVKWKAQTVSLDAGINRNGVLQVQGWEGQPLDGVTFGAPNGGNIPIYDTIAGANKWYARKLVGGISVNDTGFVSLTGSTLTLNGDVIGTAAQDTVVGIGGKSILSLAFPTAGVLIYSGTQWVAHTFGQDISVNSSAAGTVTGIQTVPIKKPVYNNYISYFDSTADTIKWQANNAFTSIYGIAPIQIHGGDTVGINLVAGAGITISAGATADTIKTTSSGVTSVTATYPVISSGGATPNISLQNPLPVVYGGTKDTTLAAHGVLIGEDTNSVVTAVASADGQIFTGKSALDPVWNTMTGDATFSSTGMLSLAWISNYLKASMRVGRGAGNVGTATGDSNLVIGDSVGGKMTTGHENTAAGIFAFQSNTTGFANDAFGFMADNANTTGISNDAFGWKALAANTTGLDNDAFGSVALTANTTGISNSAFGVDGLAANTTGSYNTAVGIFAGLHITTGDSNTTVGANSFKNDTVGNYNSALGYNALFGTNADSNTAIGYFAGSTNTTGTQNTYLGSQANCSSGTLTNSTAIGAKATVTASNSIQLGSSAVTVINTSGNFTTTSGLTLSGASAPIRLNGSVGTSKQILISQGASATPAWINQGFGTYTLGSTANQTAGNVFLPLTNRQSASTNVQNAGDGAQTVMPYAGTMQNLYIVTKIAPGAGQSYTFTIMKNRVATALVVTITGAATTTGNDTIDTFTFSAGDELAIRVNVGASASALPSWDGGVMTVQ